MKKKLLGAFAGLVLAFTSFTACAGPERMRYSDLMDGFHNAAWLMACEAKKVDCTLLEQPVVAYSIMPKNTLGLYPRIGGWIVLVNIDLVADPASVPVMIHEMIHFLQHEEGFSGNRCEREQQAFELTLEIAQKYHLDTSSGGVVPWYMVARQYGCWLYAS